MGKLQKTVIYFQCILGSPIFGPKIHGSMLRVSPFFLDLAPWDASEPAHWRQDAQVGQVSEVVNNKLSEFSEQISHLDSGDGS